MASIALSLVVVRAAEDSVRLLQAGGDQAGTVLQPSGESPSSTGTDPRTVLDSALRDFDKAVSLQSHRGDEAKALYRSALAGFEGVVNSGVRNGHLYYDIANTHMRLGDVGRAIANYRRAQKLLPGDQDVNRNLAFARSLCELRIEPRPTTAILRTLLFWHYDYSPTSRLYAAVVAYVVFWGVLILLLFVRRRVPALNAVAVIAGLVAGSAGISVVYETRMSGSHQAGVVVADEATLRKGNGEAYEPQLDRPLPEGVEFQILDQRSSGGGEAWYHIELADGNDGWLRGDQIESY